MRYRSQIVHLRMLLLRSIKTSLISRTRDKVVVS